MRLLRPNLRARIYSPSVIKNGNVLLLEGMKQEIDIRIENGIITTIGNALTGEMEIEAGGYTVLPGLIDLHTHGIGKVSTDEGTLEEYAALEASRGTTTFYPTMFGPPEVTVENLKRHLDETDNLSKTPRLCACAVRR